jgi:putative membrane protein
MKTLNKENILQIDPGLRSLFIKIGLMLLLAGSFFSAAANHGSRDEKFIRCAADNGMMEVKLGQLALSKAISPEIKAASQRMIDDHSKANEELRSLAGRKNLAFPSSMSKMLEKKYDKLAKLEGKKFGKRYSKCMVHSHKKAVRFYKMEARKGKDAELKAWANGMVPTMEQHLVLWKETCKALKKQGS